MFKDIRAELELYNDVFKDTEITATVTDGSSYDSTAVKVDSSMKLYVNWTSSETASDRAINAKIKFTFATPVAVVGMRFYGNLAKAKYEYRDAYGSADANGGGLPHDASNGVNFGEYSNGMNSIPQCGIASIEITVTELATDDIHAHLDYVQFSVIENISSDKLYAITANKAMSYVAEETNGGEFSLAYDKDKSDILRNATRLAIPNSVKKNKTCTIYASTDTESDILFYKYITTDIIIDDDTIKVYGVDILTILNESIYSKGIVYENGRSLYDWAIDVSSDINTIHPDITFEISKELRNIISYGYITEVPHREALRLIAEAGNVFLFVNENGGISISGSFNGNTNITYLADESVVQDSLSVAHIEGVQGVIVNKYGYSSQDFAVELGYIERVVLTTELQHFDITYAQFPVKNESVRIFYNGTNIQVENFHAYADRVEFDIKGEAGQATFITVVGIPYDMTNTTVAVGETSKNAKEIKDNFLIGDYIVPLGEGINHGKMIADYQLETLSGKYLYSWEDVTGDIMSTPCEISFITDTITGLQSLVLITGIELTASDTDASIGLTGITR